MLTYFILALAVLSVSLDWLLFRRLARKYPARRALRRTYLTASIAIDAVIVVALALYRRTSEAESEQYMRLIMWVIWLFFARIVPKIVYAAWHGSTIRFPGCASVPRVSFHASDWLPQP